MSVMTAIDGKKLRELLVKDGTKLVEHDRRVGYKDEYFHNCIRRNKVNNIGLKYIFSLGINLSQIMPETSDDKDVYIDEDKMKIYLQRQNMSMSDISKSIGRGRNFINEHIRLNTPIKYADYLAILSLYNVDLGKSTPNIEKAENKAPAQPKAGGKPTATKLIVNDCRKVSELTANELEKLIYRATYSPIIRANKMLDKIEDKI